MSAEGYSGLSKNVFMNVDQARAHYRYDQRDSLFASEVDKQLIEYGIAAIEMPISDGDFEQLIASYEVCLEECPDVLRETRHLVDRRFGNEAGHVRKNRKISKTTQRQIQDPKNYMHFNEYARKRWQEELRCAPKVMCDFLEAGYEIHSGLIQLARRQYDALSETHPNILPMYFPGPKDHPTSHSYLRVLSYDAYEIDPDNTLGDVAKPHFDIGGGTIQAYADARGFWGLDQATGERVYHDTADNEAYFFMGRGHTKLYDEPRIKPLYHGVERVVPAGITYVPKRHSIVLFIDTPLVDYNVTAEDTLPYLQSSTVNDPEAVGY